MGILDRIRDIEAEMARTQKNKATEHHLGMLKAKLAKFRSELIEGSKSGGGPKGDGFDTKKRGVARVALVGFPSVGKSTLMTKITETEAATGAYEIHGAEIQLLDLPGIIEGASEGRGRGRQVIAAARTADLVLLMLDAARGEVHRELLENELESVGIKLNQRPPDIVITKKKTGGMTFNSTVPLTHLSEKLCREILHLHKIHSVDVLVREDATIEQFIDMVEGNRQYMRCLHVYNKIDQITLEEVDELARTAHSVVISCEWELNLDYLRERIWESLELMRVYTKRKGEGPDFSEPVIMRSGSTMGNLCDEIHREIRSQFKHALVWGISAKHSPQRVGLNHELADEDVVTIVT